MRVVIIGGKGMIGQALSKELVEHGHQVTILSRREGKDLTAGFVQQKWDGKDAAQLAVLLDGQDA
ncbi:MAG TPA: NAD-dependent epimerase/dehydratase family protein, partial [Leptolinea sp.]